MLKLDWECKTHTQLVLETKLLWANILKENEVGIGWTPGHATIEGNEITYRLAKEAAAEAGKIKGKR
ncbi:hypothetical protein DPMN_168309 [Dreissena polymorpha]|uniref:RNase H type-1 domain-containing protein n=1 Tax=Dreissena polymorpha TaxID=45954 RepID=A0A9D4IZ64_DREPO|nr:hypothetical protein DPMN_168309 [Dreissena polymorpha]